MSETNNSQESTNKSMLVLNFKFAIPALTFLVITSTLFAVMYWGIPAVIKECQNWIYILMFYTIIAIIVVCLCFVTIKLMNHYAQSFNSVQEVEIKLYEEREKYKLKNEKKIHEKLQELEKCINDLKQPMTEKEAREKAKETERLNQQNQLLQEKIEYLEKINERLSKYKTI